jgi:RNA polymerase sigma-70 factor (ECF subfamily)
VDPLRTRSFEARLDEMAGMRRLARSLLRDASLADDVVQEAALAAWKRGREYEVPPRSWWAAVVRNVAAKMGRGSRRRESRERASARFEAQPGADVVARRLALHRAVVAAVERLVPEQRDVVVRRWFDAQKPQRIAKELGVPLATVKTRLRRALAQLRTRLRGEWGDGVAGALVTLARPYATPIAVSSITAGALLMGMKLKVAAAFVVAAIACAWIAGELQIGREAANPSDVAQASQPAAVAAGSSASPATSPAVVRADERPAPEATPRAPEDPRRFASITGVVLGPRGPIGGAHVELVRRIGDDEMLPPALRDVLTERRRSTVSAEDGSFEFTDVRRGIAFTIEAAAEPDLAAATSTPVQACDHVTVTLAPLARLTGVVRRTGGEAVADATVVVAIVGSASVLVGRRAQSDGAGRFELDRLPACPMNVRASTSAGDVMTPVRAELRGGETAEVELILGDAFAIEGLLLDEESGAAIAGASVFDDGEWSGDLAVAETDANGRFRVQAAEKWPSPNLLFARAKGYGFQSFMAPVPAASPTRFEARLRRGHALRGRVVTVDGGAVPDATVVYEGGDDFSDATKLHRSNNFGAARSAADGTFTLEDVDPRDDRLLVVRHEGSAEAAVPVLGSVTSTADLDVGDVVLRPGALVAGRVVDADGQPITHAPVTLDRKRVGTSMSPRERLRAQCMDFTLGRRTVTRSDGSFAFACVPEGDWVLSQDGRGLLARRSLSLVVHGDEIIEGVELVVGEALSISGNVVDERGAPVASASIESWMNPLSLSLSSVHSDRDGTFCLSGLPTGTFRIVARIPGSQRDSERPLAESSLDDVASGRSDVTLVMCEGVLLFGRVVTAAGAPAARARVAALGADASRLAEARCDEDGRFELVVRKSGSNDGKLKLTARGAPRGTLQHPEPSPESTLDDVTADGSELLIRLP